VLGFPIGAQEVTAAQINQYIAAVDANSTRHELERSDGASRAPSPRRGLRVVRSAGKVSFLIASPGGAEGRLAVTLGPALRRSGANVVAFVAPR
jgi:hypothetical protein